METNLDVADKSGARRVQSIMMLGGTKRASTPTWAPTSSCSDKPAVGARARGRRGRRSPVAATDRHRYNTIYEGRPRPLSCR